jgi:hypothetical protein
MKRHRDAAAGATPQDVAKGHVTKAKALMDAATRGLPALSAPAAAAVSQVPTSTPPWWTAHPSLHTNNLTLQQQMSRLAYLAQAHNQGAFGVGGEVQQAVPSQLLLPRFTSQLQMGQTHDGSVWCITAIPFTLTHYTITVPLPPGAWPEVQHGPPCSLTAEVYVPCSRGEQQQQQIMAPGGLDMPGEWRVLTSAPAMLCSCQGGALLYSSGLAAGLAGQQDLHLLRAQRNPVSGSLGYGARGGIAGTCCKLCVWHPSCQALSGKQGNHVSVGVVAATLAVADARAACARALAATRQYLSCQLPLTTLPC